jgi:hypothetical protein
MKLQVFLSVNFYLINESTHPSRHSKDEQISGKQYQVAITVVWSDCHTAHVQNITKRDNILPFPVPHASRQNFKL